MSGLQALPAESPTPSPRSDSAKRAAVAAALVLLLHALLLWVFVHSFYKPQTVLPRYHEEPITLWLTQPRIHASAAPVPVIRPHKKKRLSPYVTAPVPKAQGLPVPPPARTAPLPGIDYNGLRALGQYLYNCSHMNYGYLSPRNRLHCELDLWDLPPENPGEALRLGKEAPSIWKSQRDKAKAPPRTFTKPCAASSPNSNLGLPCYNLAH